MVPSATPESQFFVTGLLSGPPGSIIWLTVGLALIGSLGVLQVLLSRPKLTVSFPTGKDNWRLVARVENRPLSGRLYRLLNVQRPTIPHVGGFCSVHHLE